MRTYTINAQEVVVESRTLNLNDRLNERTTCSFVVAEPSFPIEVGMEVVITDGETIFAGTIDDETKYGDLEPRVAVSCVDFSQLIDKRKVADAFVNTDAGDMVRKFITDVFSQEGVSEGNIQQGPTLTAAVFPYENGNEAMNKLATLSGYAWEINALKELNFFDRSTYRAPFDLTDDSQNYKDLRVKTTRGQYRNRQYVRAGQNITQEILNWKPSPSPDGVSRTFVVRLPVATKPRIYVNSVEIDPSDIGIGGLDSSKKWYWNKGSNALTQDEAEGVLVSTDVLEISFKGLYPIIVVADDPAEISSRKTAEGGTGIHEALDQEPNIDTQSAAFDFAQGKLDRFGYIPKIVTWNTTHPGLKAGQLISITNAQKGLAGDFLVESVSARDAGNITRYDIKALDGSALGGWEQLFKTLLQGGKQLVIRENEVLVLLNSIYELGNWSEVLNSSIYPCPVPSDTLYPSEELIPC